MRRVMSSACISDPRDLRQAILAAGETREALITELTIGETYFLREPGQFDFLRSTVIPELRETAGQRRLRVWSAGCATGEEPYSLAMTLREASWPGATSILGTDLASARLVAARRGRYTAWSMRGVNKDIIARYFEQRGRHFILRPDLRDGVEFGVLNLASDEYPSALNGVERMDIVFCRNVLIYFDQATVAAIAARLIATLAPGGWLFLGASDPSIAELVPCEVVLTGAGLAYRAPGTTAPRREIMAPSVELWAPEPFATMLEVESVPVAGWTAPDERMVVSAATVAEPFDAATPLPVLATEADDSYEGAYARSDYDAAIALARRAIDLGDDTEGVWITLVRGLANRGALSAAGEACARALETHRMSAELTHLHGVLLAEGGMHAEAAAAARRALYMDPGYAVAHLALGDALARIGDVTGARRSFANAATILMRLPPDAPVPGADGAGAAQLAGIATFRREALAGPGEGVR